MYEIDYEKLEIERKAAGREKTVLMRKKQNDWETE